MEQRRAETAEDFELRKTVSKRLNAELNKEWIKKQAWWAFYYFLPFLFAIFVWLAISVFYAWLDDVDKSLFEYAKESNLQVYATAVSLLFLAPGVALKQARASSIAQFRQKWISELRQAVSEFYATLANFFSLERTERELTVIIRDLKEERSKPQDAKRSAEIKEDLQQNQQRLNELLGKRRALYITAATLKASISLMLNTNKPLHAEAMYHVDESLRAISKEARGSMGENEVAMNLGNRLELLVDTVTELLKEEWKEIERDIR